MALSTDVELTLRGVILAIILTIILAMSNTYLALKLGLLASASIPASLVSMGILRFFKGSNKLENNIVQTAASAGEAVAGGIVYTIPALIVIGFWHKFDYIQNVMIILSGGILGVLFSIPLRRLLVHDKTLAFPEGRAIAAILNSPTHERDLGAMFYGAVIGGMFELLQIGFKLLASSASYCVIWRRTLFSFSAGFSATMLGAGYLIGFDMACSIFLGAIIAWLVVLPISSNVFFDLWSDNAAHDAVMLLWDQKLRYIGIGAMLFAGICTLLNFLKPLTLRMYSSVSNRKTITTKDIIRTERDIPKRYLVFGVVIMTYFVWQLFHSMFPTHTLGLNKAMANYLVIGAVAYVLVIGFLFAIITAYFSGMVGVTASPGSSIVIAGILLAAGLLLITLKNILRLPLDDTQLLAAEAIVIIIGSVVTGIAAIANDNTQDLKVGNLIGATPWKQQIMLLLGVIVAAFVIPWVLQLLFAVYGIAGVMPHANMPLDQSLPAPVAAMLAAMTQAFFHEFLPWSMLGIGALIICIILIFNAILGRRHPPLARSTLGVAIGLYLPFTTSLPLFLGGLFAYLMQRKIIQSHIGARVACGLLTGAALMDVVLALAFALYHSPNALSLVDIKFLPYSVILSVLAIIVLGRVIYHRGVAAKED